MLFISKFRKKISQDNTQDSNNQEDAKKTSSDILTSLNKEQLEAVTTTEGYVRVIAGAGSGKTKALTTRYVYLVKELGIAPASILCVTFTNKAANEMKKRIRKMIVDGDLSLITTFHGFCVKLLKEDSHVVGYPSNFIILDDSDTEDILKDIFVKFNISTVDLKLSEAKKYINDTKQLCRTYVDLLIDYKLDKLNEKRNLSDLTILEKVFYEFLYVQRKTFGMDFNDLIIFAFHILSTDERVKMKWQKRLQYIMVDEFQDVSGNQYLLSTILSDYHKNLFVVGDPDQTIYTWRGANIDSILHFDKHFPNTKTIIMNKNYRSLPEILKASNALIKKNKNRIEKELVPNRNGLGKSIYFHAKTTSEEALWITNQIKGLNAQGISFSKIAILYRASFLSRLIEETFVKNQIPYTLLSGISFYQRKEIKDIFAYFRMITSGDDVAFKRTINEPGRGIGRKRMAFLQSYAEEKQCSLYQALKDNLTNSLIQNTKANDYILTIEKIKSEYKDLKISEVLNKVLNETGYEELIRKSGEDERRDNISELKQSIFDYEETAGEEVFLEDYLNDMALYTNIDKQQKLDSVSMMPIHSAKGLEFPFVFVCGLSENIFPSRHICTLRGMEEERRLAYVAFTRAEDKLFLSDAEGINYDGSHRYPSRFIFNCEKVNLDYVVELPKQLVDETNHEIERSNMIIEVNSKYRIGDRVSHDIFGEGIITDMDQNSATFTIKFDNIDTPRTLAFTVNLELLKQSESKIESSNKS